MDWSKLRVATRLSVVACAGLVLAWPASPARAGGIGCGSVLTGGTHTLTGNVGPCDTASGTAAIQLDSATLDLQGFTISCSDTNPVDATVPDGVVLLGSKAQVLNGFVIGCHRGVVLSGDGKHTVGSVTVFNTLDAGFVVEEQSGKNTIGDSQVVNSAGSAFQIDGDKNKIHHCNALDTPEEEDGFEASGNKNAFAFNSATNTDDGFDIDGASNKLTDNTSTGNFRGIILQGEKNKVVRNTITNNETLGVRVDTALNKVIKNTVTGNGESGIRVGANADVKVTIVKNTATGNASVVGFDLEDGIAGCGSHVWKKNVFGTRSDDTCIE